MPPHHDTTAQASLEVARDALRRTSASLAHASPTGPLDAPETYLALGLLTQCVAAADGVLDGLGRTILEREHAAPDAVSSATAVMALARASELCDALRLTIENAHIAVSGAVASAGPGVRADRVDAVASVRARRGRG